MPIIIIGMHRSGTSMVTRLLHDCGLYLGTEDDLYLGTDGDGIDQDNPEGYWENKAIVSLNDDLLSHLGGSWDYPPVLQKGWSEDAALNIFAYRFEAITTGFNQHPFWGWKDPRNSLTLEFWLRHVPNLKVLLCLRNPLEVSHSLSTGEPLRKLDRLQALKLWQTYYETILQLDIVDDLVITHYESYFYDPEAELHRILAALEMSATDADIRTASSTIKPNLKRQYIPDMLLEDESIPAAVRQYYQFLCARAGSVFDRLRTDSDYLYDTTRIATVRLYHQTNQLSSQVAQLDSEVAQLDSQVTQLSSQVAQQRRSLEQQQHMLVDRQRQIEQQRHALIERSQQVQILHNALETMTGLTHVALQGFKYRRVQLSRIIQLASKLSNWWSIRRVTAAVQNGKLPVPKLFDTQWYLQQYPDVQQSGIHPYVHFWLFGWYQGYQPMPLFDVNWYTSRYPHFNDQWANPLEHYENIGQYTGHRPCALFDPQWYLEQYSDVKIAGVDPLYHYYHAGWREGRNPSPDFDTISYLRKNPDVQAAQINPLVHYLTHSAPPLYLDNPITSLPAPPSNQALEDSFLKASDLPTYQSDHPRQITDPAVQLVAFYLPQFHPTEVNDTFWGKGFTEWTNVTRAQPLFEGHYQPKLPGELGFYDLRVVDTLREQARLARVHGLAAFCIYRYWFNGKTVLDTPLELLYEHDDIDIGYCLCWANENWTRRWDGMEHEVLLFQEHNPEDDLQFIADAERFFQDRRYLRIDNKPVLVIYNVGKIPDPLATAKRWQAFCKEKGYEGIYLIAQQTFNLSDHVTHPEEIGFDAILQMPPHHHFENIAHRFAFFTDFEGEVHRYEDLVEAYTTPVLSSLPLFRTVAPGWDNTARRGKRSKIFVGDDNEQYEKWLRAAIAQTLKERASGERLVFINAWNEWAEGAYLEPDRKYGYTKLNTTSLVLSTFSQTDILVTAPNADRAGSQIVLLSLVEWLVQHTSLNIKVILQEGGVLLNSYKAVAPTLVLADLEAKAFTPQQITTAIKQFCGNQVGLIYNNTCVPGELVSDLPYSAPVITHMHELQMSIEQYCADSMSLLCQRTNHFIAVSSPVADLLQEQYRVDPDAITQVSEFVVTWGSPPAKRDEGIVVVWGCGTVSLRKGFDLFTEVAKQVRDRGIANVQFRWIGRYSADFPDPQAHIVQQGAEDCVLYVGEEKHPREHFAVGDIFFLASREDPHPLVVLEAADAGLPTVCFADTGGTPAFVQEDAGFVVPQFDVTLAADRIITLVQDEAQRLQAGANARSRFLQDYERAVKMPYILQTIRRVSGMRPKVSVIVPAYRHAQHLRQRLDSIYQQTFQDFEVILLDDASPDDSADILRDYARRHASTQLILNDTNSGSTFSQWIKGLHAAQGDLIWIAEDDDFCEPTFLEKLLPYFTDPDVRLAYCQSYGVDAEGNILFNYQQYVTDLSEERWQHAYVSPAQFEIRAGLAKKNTIPNASAVLFRKFDFSLWAEEWSSSKLTGDWAFYLYAIRGGKIAFHPEVLNYHRRHEKTNITQYQYDERRFMETVKVQQLVLRLYESTPEIRSLMRQGSLELWKEIYSDRSEAEFDDTYQSLLEDQSFNPAINNATIKQPSPETLTHYTDEQ